MPLASLLQFADVVLEGALDVPCELRWQHKATKKFLTVRGSAGHSPKFVDRWQDASYYGSTIDNDDENTFEFQWQWNFKECDEVWMEFADKNEYRLHVVIGSHDSE